VRTADIAIDRLARWAGGSRQPPHPHRHEHKSHSWRISRCLLRLRRCRCRRRCSIDVRGTKWHDYFGEVLISSWDPVEANPSTGAELVGNITNYANGLKIDFSFWSPQHFADVTAGPDPYAEFDAGYWVVVDKDGLTTVLPAPTFGSCWRPSAAHSSAAELRFGAPPPRFHAPRKRFRSSSPRA
jgi:Streptomycin adenylyltransferase